MKVKIIEIHQLTKDELASLIREELEKLIFKHFGVLEDGSHMDEKWTVSRVARHYNVSRQTIYQWIRKNWISPDERIGNHLFFLKSKILKQKIKM